MKIIEHGKYGKFTVCGTCPVCGCVFETVVVKGEHKTYSCEDAIRITDANGYPIEFICNCPECKLMNVGMKVMNRE